MCCSTLRAEGWRVEEMGREDDTPIHSAARDGDLATVKDLVAEGFGGCPAPGRACRLPAFHSLKSVVSSKHFLSLHVPHSQADVTALAGSLQSVLSKPHPPAKSTAQARASTWRSIALAWRLASGLSGAVQQWPVAKAFLGALAALQSAIGTAWSWRTRHFK